MKTSLTTEEMTASTHTEVEDFIFEKGWAVLQSLYQSHLSLRGQAEPVEAPRGSDGTARGYRRSDTSWPMTSLFGEVTVPRSQYERRGLTSLHPVDAALNLPSDRYSLPVRKRVALAGAVSSFEATVQTLATTTGAKVPKRQVEELVRRSAVDFEAYYAGTESTADPETTGGVLVLTTDGKGVVMRTEALREATQKAALASKPKLSTRLSKGEKRNRKRMATVAAVYTVEPHVRTAAEVVAGLHSVGPARSEGERTKRPRPEDKRVWASVERSAETVIAEAFAEADGRDPRRQKRWVVVVDGAEHQLALIKAAAARHGADVTIVLDFIHVLEYLWKASHVFHKDGTPQAEKWVMERLLRVLAGHATQVATGIRRSATKRGLEADDRKRADKCADYLGKYADYLRYDRYLARGLPIASGVIEGACRHLIADRLDITGARWSVAGAEAVLKLRALRSSDDFEDYWSFHEEQELARNHRAKYAGGKLPDLVHPTAARHLRVIK